jgi:hypothetical protein
MYSTHVLKARAAWMGRSHICTYYCSSQWHQGLNWCSVAWQDTPLSVRIELSMLCKVKTSMISSDILFIVSYCRLSVVSADDNPMIFKLHVVCLSFLTRLFEPTSLVSQNSMHRLAVVVQAPYMFSNKRRGGAAGAHF